MLEKLVRKGAGVPDKCALLIDGAGEEVQVSSFDAHVNGITECRALVVEGSDDTQLRMLMRWMLTHPKASCFVDCNAV